MSKVLYIKPDRLLYYLNSLSGLGVDYQLVGLIIFLKKACETKKCFSPLPVNIVGCIAMASSIMKTQAILSVLSFETSVSRLRMCGMTSLQTACCR